MGFRLARIAQIRSDQYIYYHDCENCQKVLNYGLTINVGQNAFSKSGGSLDWTGTINAYLRELRNFRHGKSGSEGIKT
jgi:hypothetical protein